MKRHKVTFYVFKTLGIACLALVVFTVACFLTVPVVYSAAAAALPAVFVSGSKIQNIFLLAVSIALSFSLLSAALYGFSSLHNQTPYYRPHEKLKTQEALYRPNAELHDFSIPFGDIGAVDKHLPESLREPHVVDFITDDLGFRNTENLGNQRFVFIGDSFVTGNGLDQDSTIAAQAAELLPGGVYNAGFPGGISDYARIFSGYIRPRLTDAQIVLFFFEGNDFPCHEKEERPQRSLWLRPPGLVRETTLYRLYFGLTRNAAVSMGAFYSYRSEEVVIHRIGRKNTAFLLKYVHEAVSDKSCFDLAPHLKSLERFRGHVRLVVFIPTKYRVYYSLLPDGKKPVDGTLQLTARIARFLETPMLDLTPELSSAARDMLQHGDYVFWRGDTHWNAEGTRIAAQAVARALSQAQ